MKTLRITPMLQAQIDRVLRAAERYPNEDDGYLPLEREQQLLGEEVMRAVIEQSARLDRLPMKAARPVQAVVDVELRRKRRA